MFYTVIGFWFWSYSWLYVSLVFALINYYLFLCYLPRELPTGFLITTLHEYHKYMPKTLKTKQPFMGLNVLYKWFMLQLMAILFCFNIGLAFSC